MQNARLLNELREALNRQQATSEVLQVINSSLGQVEPVFDALLDKATSFCEAAFGILWTYDGENYHAVAFREVPPAYAEYLRNPPPFTPEDVIGRIAKGKSVVHIADAAAQIRQHIPLMRHAVELGGFRTILGVALRKEGTLLGAITIYRQEIRLFSDKQVALLESFAAQAVIAMENARLLDELRWRNHELAKSLEFRTAMGEVLRIVASSPDDLQSVFEAMLGKATELCGAKFGSLFLYDGQAFTVAADRNLPSDYATAVRGRFFAPENNAALRQMLERKAPVHVTDMFADAAYAAGDQLRVATVELGGVRSFVAVPLLKRGELIGYFSIYREAPGGFAENQIALVSAFADQGVIAIENARLITETREALDQQTASAEVLRVIAQSPTDVQPVLDAVAAAARRFCSAADASIILRDGDKLIRAAHDGPMPAGARGSRDPLNRSTVMGRSIIDQQLVHVPDVQSLDSAEYGRAREIAARLGWRSALAAPMMREGEAAGCILLRRPDPGPFSERQIALLETFAAQAVIAIQNVRLFSELRESLEQQTATAEVLKVINSSPNELVPVFEAMLEKAMRLCEADAGNFCTYDGQHYWMVAKRNVGYVQEGPITANPDSGAGRVAHGESIVHILDSADGDVYKSGDPGRRLLVDLGGARTQLCVGLRKDDVLLGVMIIWRREVRPFSERQIALLQNFADQAVIAMENARLLAELRQRTDDLTASLEYQTAASDLLEVISRSASDTQPVFETMLAAAMRLCECENGGVAVRADNGFRYVISRQSVPAMNKILLSRTFAVDRTTLIGRTAMEKQVVQIVDVKQDPEYGVPETVSIGHVGTVLGVPLMHNEQVVGVIVLTRLKVEPFAERQIALVRTFADQAVIAMENARLLEELRQRTDDLTEFPRVPDRYE